MWAQSGKRWEFEGSIFIEARECQRHGRRGQQSLASEALFHGLALLFQGGASSTLLCRHFHRLPNTPYREGSPLYHSLLLSCWWIMCERIEKSFLLDLRWSVDGLGIRSCWNFRFLIIGFAVSRIFNCCLTFYGDFECVDLDLICLIVKFTAAHHQNDCLLGDHLFFLLNQYILSSMVVMCWIITLDLWIQGNALSSANWFLLFWKLCSSRSS